MKKIAVVFFAFIFGACSAGKSKHMERSDLGDKWPLTVSEGTVRVLNHFEVVFESNGITYALNGNARLKIKDGVYRDIFEVVAVDTARLNSLMRANIPVDLKEVPMDIGPILEAGVAMIED